MKTIGASLSTQRSGDRHVLTRGHSIDTRNRKMNAASSRKPQPSIVTATSVKEPHSLASFAEDDVVRLEARNVASNLQSFDLVERFARAMTEVKGNRKSSASYRQTRDSRCVSERTASTSASSTLQGGKQKQSLVKLTTRRVSAAFGGGWLRKTTSCLMGRTASIDNATVNLDRHPSQDILVMVQEQKRNLEDTLQKSKNEIRATQREIEFLKRQLEAVKKTHPHQKTLMQAVDELDAMAIASRKFEWKLKVLKEERERLHRRVFAHRSAQDALESIGGQPLTIEDDAWNRDLEVFSKLAYAGLLKRHDCDVDEV